MRSIRALYTIPAHTSNVADVRFFYGDDLSFKSTVTSMAAAPDVTMEGTKTEKANADGDGNEDTSNDKTTERDLEEEWKYRSGLYFASAGYDGFVKIWSADDWQLLRTLSTDAGKVMSVDLSRDAKLLASGTYNRNFQLFAPEDIL